MGLAGTGAVATNRRIAGLIIGGAIGNAVDRLHWPGVIDFVLLHVETPGWTFRWYVFNLADVAIVAGVSDSCMNRVPRKCGKSALIRDIKRGRG